MSTLSKIYLIPLPSRFRALLTLFIVVAAAPAFSIGSDAGQIAETVGVQGRNLDYHLLNNIVLTVDQLNGSMVAVPGHMISLDDRNSFTFKIQGSIARISSTNLTALLNDYLLPRAESPIKHVSVSFEGQSVHIKGVVKKLLPIEFTAIATIAPTPSGDLRVHVVEFRVAGVLTKGFLDVLGLKLDKTAEPRHQSSFQIKGDDLIVPMRSLFPPPLVNARLTVARIEGDALYQELGHPGPLSGPPQPAPNYLYFHGGRMHFGKMTMDGVDLELIDKHPEDRFDFSLDRYLEQMAAGYARIRPGFGIIAYAEDFRSLPPRH